MKNNPKQLEIPYNSLGFVNRATLRPSDIAVKLGCSKKHVENLIEEGKLGDINISSVDYRKWSVVPVEEYVNFIIKNTSILNPMEYLKNLPTAVISEYINVLYSELNKRKNK